MIYRFSYCWLAVLALAFSCNKASGDISEPGIEISVRCCNPALSKADSDDTRDGEDRYNENLITDVDFFFYPGDIPDRNADAVYHVHRTSGLRGSDVFLLDLTESDVSHIFPEEPVEIRKATVFAIANYQGTLVPDESDLSGTSLSVLEAKTVETNFVQTRPTSYPNLAPQNYKQSSFLMSGTTIINLRSRTSNIVATGAIDLIRYACKMTVAIKVAERVSLGESVWEPMLEGMAIYLVNGVNTVKLGGEDPAPDYFSFYDNPRQFAYIDSQDGDKVKPLVSKDGGYYLAHPMYMYPQHWTYGESEESTASVEPYLKLELPWHRTAEGGYSSTQKQCYYKIFIPDDSRGEDYLRHFVRNNWYHLVIDVGLMGSDTDDDEAVTLTGSFFMVPWQNVDQDIVRMADIGKARYLSVDRTNYELHNVNSVLIRYTSSHPVSVTGIKVTRPYYGTATSGPQLGGTVKIAGADNPDYAEGSKYLEFSKEQREAMNGGQDWFSDIGTAIVYNHQLVNDYTTKSFDYSPYHISLSMVHADRPYDATYKKDVVLVQYPGIYITSTPNNDPLTGPGGKPLHWGYVYVDGEQYTLAQYDEDSNNNKDANWRKDHLWRVVYYSSGGRDSFRINVTSLPDDSEFIIGDPREDDINNLRPENDFFKTRPAIEGGERSLTWYYPTEESSRTIDMIAPAYRVSTKLSGIEYNGITFEKAKERCASFQENGFPAGRWRLPTRGEIRFISKLSSLGFFEWQFGGSYWTANGGVSINKDTGVITDVSPSVALLRCIYDSWYWGDDQVDNLEQFTWGDAER